MSEVRFTPSGVRLREHSRRPGDLDWLLLPGGPGIGSESLQELADALDVPGAVSSSTRARSTRSSSGESSRYIPPVEWPANTGFWTACAASSTARGQTSKGLSDAPGADRLEPSPGKSTSQTAPGTSRASDNPFDVWPRAVLEAAQAVQNPVFAGHSTGGMYLLDSPELERVLRALVLLDTAPDAAWHARYVEMTRQRPLPEVDAAMAIYEADPRDENIAAVAVASAPWNFTPRGLERGRELLARMPYNAAAVAWSDANFDHVYAARWWPTAMPVLRLAGRDDHIVWQGGWSDRRFQTPNVIERLIDGAGHFPWIESPEQVRAAFGELADRLLTEGSASKL